MVFARRLVTPPMLLAALLAFQPAAALAQSVAQSVAPPEIPAKVEPGRIMGARELLAEPKSKPAEPVVSRSTLTVPDGAEAQIFAFHNLRIDGAAAIPAEQLLALWKPVRGDRVSVADLYHYAGAITRLYAARGYALSFALVPDQDVSGGDVVIEVLEGYIDRIAMQGDGTAWQRRKNDDPIQAIAGKILASRPLRVADLERYLLLIRDIPGIELRSVISPSPDNRAGAVLTLKLTRKAAGVEAGYNNFMSALFGRHVAGGQVALHGVLTGTDRIGVSVQKGLEHGSYKSIAADYATLVGSDGLRVGFALSQSRTRPISGFLRALDYAGASTDFVVDASYPLIRSRNENLDIMLGSALLHSDSELLGVPLARDRLRNVSAAFAYDFAASDGSVAMVRVGIERGLNIFSADGNSRANGSARYALLNFASRFSQPVAQVAGAGLSFLAAIQGQIALGAPLLSKVECAYGGRPFGRRYDAGEITGDHCLLASLEFRLDADAPLLGSKTGFGWQSYAFIDSGYVRQKGVLQPRELRDQGASGIGGGVRVALGRLIGGSFEVSRSLKAPQGFPFEHDMRVTGGVTVRW